MLGKPQLSHDLGCTEITAESLMTGGAKPTTDGTPCLGGDTQGAPVIFGDENTLHGIAVANIEQPFEGSVSGDMLRQYRQCANRCSVLQLPAKGMGQIAHLPEVVDATLVNPAKELGGTKTLFAQPFAKAGQPIQVKVEKVGHQSSEVAIARDAING